MPTAELKKNQKLHGFEIYDVTELEELNATLYRLEHEKTGARLVHIQTEDSNNLFAVGFRTPPQNSTGVAHILEHTVLCGSQRYPVRDPFFSMLKRSLNTFMNALTASDWTLYPFSSQNEKDFYNLMEIYLDAAFFPLLRERDFSQEGYRIEFADGNQADSPLVYKGVVYNEMKGAMSDPSSLLYRRLGKALYPTVCYHHNSGGEPSDIPNLSWQQLRDFHANYYHPSNAWFFTYGDLPLENHLQVIEQRALQRFDRREVDSAVPPESFRSEPLTMIETFPLDPAEPAEKKSIAQLAWLTCDISDSFERLALNLLSTLLLGNPAAPLYKALLDSGLGSNLAPGTGYQEDNRTTYFAAGLQNINPEDAPKVEQLIVSTLEQISREGFSSNRIEGAIHRLEFGHKEVTGDQYPYSLGLLMRIIGPWLHNNDPVSSLKLDTNLERLRKEIADGPFFENLIRRYLLDNPHRVTLVLKPDQAQQEREEKETAARLKEIQTQLSDKEKEQILLRGKELQEAQEAEEDLSCLPTLELQDIPPTEKPVPSTFTQEAHHQVQWFNEPTNGIGYFIAHLPTDHLPEELLPYVPLFCTTITKVGAAGYSYLEMAERMEAGTGGIHFGTGTIDAIDTMETFEGLIELKGKALIRNQDKLFGILNDIFAAPDFSDLKRLQTVIGQMKTSLENSIPGSGHNYAARSAASTLTPAARRRELWGGLSQVRLVRHLAELETEQLQEVSGTLRTLAERLLANENIHCAITAEERHFEAIRNPLRPFLATLPAAKTPLDQRSKNFAGGSKYLGWATSVPVSYVTRVFPAVPFLHPDGPALSVLARLMRASFLHREIREKGGAYGGMASYSTEGGLFSLLSYRDPHIVRTLEVYDDAIDWAVSGDFSTEEIKEAVLAVFSDLDRPLSPGGKGSREFGNTRQGLTLEMRQEFRERVLAVNKDSLVQVAERYLKQGREKSSVSVISSEEALSKANEQLNDKKLTIERI